MRSLGRRDEFTCDTCLSAEWHGLDRYCTFNRRPIRWDATSFGCGNYTSSEREDRVLRRRRGPGGTG